MLSKSSKVWKVTDIIARSSVLVTAALWLLKCYLLYISHDLSWKQLPGEDRRGEQGTLFVLWASSMERHHYCRHVQTSHHGTLTTLPPKSHHVRDSDLGLGLQHTCFGETQALSLKLFPFSFLIARQVSGVAQLMLLWHHFLPHSFIFKWWNNEIISISLHSRVYYHYKKSPLMPFVLSLLIWKVACSKILAIITWAYFRGNCSTAILA